MQAFDAQLPPLAVDEHGVIRVGGTRVSLESVVRAFDRGASAEEIAKSFPALDLASVYATLAYVLTHRTRVDEYLSRRNEIVEIQAMKLKNTLRWMRGEELITHLGSEYYD